MGHRVLFLAILFMGFGFYIKPMKAWGSFPEFFGASSRSASLGNQFTDDAQDVGNNYYAPALMAFSQKLSMSLTANVAETDFYPIRNVTLRNAATHTSTQTGDVPTNYDTAYISSLHLAVPLLRPLGLRLGASVFAPINYLQETNTGDTYLPEYAMYKARYKRVQAFLNGAYAVHPRWAVSLGAHVGIQISADTYTVADTGSTIGTQARAKAQAKPSIAGIVSVAHKFSQGSAFFTYQQEMKQKLQAVVYGETTAPISLSFNTDMGSTLYYDPHIFRLGSGYQLTHWLKLLGSVEYQVWSGYQSPVIRVKQRGGIIKGSKDYEQLSVENIYIPKLGVEISPTEKLKVRLGGQYRPTPFKSDFSGPGNTVDTNSYLVSGGLGYGIKLFNQNLELDGSVQYHVLDTKTVVKSPNMEDGSTGNKVGAPGYKIGGNVYSAGLGIRASF